MKPTTAILALMTLPLAAAPDSKFPPKPDPAEVKAKVDAAVAKVDKVIEAGPFKPQADSLRKIGIPEWYADAKLGIFIHWGVYSVPAFGNEWYPRHMYKSDDKTFAHHVETFGPQNEFGYKDFIPKFTAENFDAKRWAGQLVSGELGLREEWDRSAPVVARQRAERRLHRCNGKRQGHAVTAPAGGSTAPRRPRASRSPRESSPGARRVPRHCPHRGSAACRARPRRGHR